jgi:hypothetical protein
MYFVSMEQRYNNYYIERRLNMSAIFNNKREYQSLTMIDSYFENLSCMIETLTKLDEECFNICSDHLTANYYYLKENNKEVLLEGFSDFLSSVIKFFKNMLKVIKDFSKSAFTHFTAYFMEFDKFLKANEEKLSKLNIDFTQKGFSKYTINSNCPDMSFIKSLISAYPDDITDFEKYIDKYKARKADEDNDMDTPKKYVLDEKEKYASTEFLIK